MMTPPTLEQKIPNLTFRSEPSKIKTHLTNHHKTNNRLNSPENSPRDKHPIKEVVPSKDNNNQLDLRKIKEHLRMFKIPKQIKINNKVKHVRMEVHN